MNKDKVDDLIIIVKALSLIAEEQYIPSPFENKAAETESVMLIRELRQTIERLRRVVGESDIDEPPRSLTDMNKLHKDELAFVAWQFWEWADVESCPAEKCLDFPCRHRKDMEAVCQENLKNGDLDEAGFTKQKENGFFAEYCDTGQQSCWAQYYLWCYRNGFDPQKGVKKTE